MFFLSLLPALFLEASAGDILYFWICQQISWKDQSLQYTIQSFSLSVSKLEVLIFIWNI